MIVDRHGKKITIGSEVLLTLLVTNLIADSERVNIVCQHVDQTHGVPDDYRIALAGSSVELLSSPTPVLQPVGEPEVLQPAEPA